MVFIVCRDCLNVVDTTCPNCNSLIPDGRSSCNSCGTPIKQNESGGFCSNCGSSLTDKSASCPQCGHTKTTFNTPPSPNLSGTPHTLLYKSEGTALILAIILGLFGLNGIGHLYLGKISRGVGLLIGSIVLFWVGIATLIFVVGAVLLVIYFLLFIWQIIDAKNQCRAYNEYVQANGKAPDN